MNLLIFLNAFDDETETNNPSRNHFRWTRDLQSLSVSEPTSKCLTLPAGQSLSLFAGIQSTSADATTTWDIALKSGSSNTYVISHASGTAPDFRTKRVLGSDATTEVTVTKNAKLATFASTGGTPFDLTAAGMVVGDEVRIGPGFNVNSQGKFKVLSFTTTSFTIENELTVAEGPIILGADFDDDVRAHSADGIQVGDKVDIIAGFSPASFGTYEITDVADNFIEFFSLEALPTESAISNNPDAFLIYRDAKSFLYIESDQTLDIKINGSAVTNNLVPLRAGVEIKPGVFMSSGSLKSAEIINTSQESASIFYATAE